MTFEQLEAFVAVTEHDTLFDAAEALHISQSALSKQIQKLEKELDLLLLDRTHRRACLTPAGEQFSREAKILLRQYQHMMKNLQPYRTNRPAVRLGALPILPQYGLTSKLRRFTTVFPQWSLEWEEGKEGDLLRGLEQGFYDLVLARALLFPEERYQTYPVARDELVAVLPSDHPLAQKMAPVSLVELQNEPFLLMNRYTSIYQQCVREFQKTGIPASHIVRTARVESILSAVAIGEGVSLLARSSFSVFQHEQVTALSLKPPVSLPVVLAHAKDRPLAPGARALLTFLCKSTEETCP